MKRRILIAAAVLVGLIVTGLLVAASIWPVINEVETGATPEYPDVQPQYYTTEPRRVFDESVGAVEELEQWTLVSSDPAQWRIEAERETDVFGFVDDITVTIEPVTEFVTRVNVRSSSRVGKGDFGQNARNIEELFDELDNRLGAVKFDPDKLREGETGRDERTAPGEQSDEAGDAPADEKADTSSDE
ncbi:MAG: DUF1499 domain-containing protein [Myxococcota bacterium]